MHLFSPCLCRQILHIAFAMRPVCLLGRTKNLHQSDRLHFISDSFITETDVLGKGKPLYVIRRTIEGDGEPFGDGSHIVYVNASIVDDTPLGKLMHDFQCVQPEEMYYPVLAERAGAFKNTEKGEIYMSSKWEQFVEEVRTEIRAEERARAKEYAIAQGMETERLFSIRRMMEKLSLTAEKAMDVLAIPQSEWSRYKAML